MTMYMCQDTGLELLTYSDVPDDFVCPEGWVLMTLAERDALSATRTAMAELRTQRDKLLVASDWTQVADAPIDQATWAIYRQSLRDMPATFTGGEVTWPAAPA